MKIVTLKYPVNAVTDILLCLLCVFCIVLIFQYDENRKVQDVFLCSENVISFLEYYGWKVDSESEETSNMVLPSVQNDVFNDYNKLQISQGFDLIPYMGKEVKKYTYLLNENPYKDKYDTIYATVLTYKDKIIGADIYSPSLDGFIRGVVTR